MPTKGFDVAPIRADRIRNRFLAPRSDDKPSVSYLDIIEYCNTHDISGYIPVRTPSADVVALASRCSRTEDVVLASRCLLEDRG